MLTDKNPDFESAANALHFLSENRNLVELEKAIAAKQSPKFFTFLSKWKKPFQKK